MKLPGRNLVEQLLLGGMNDGVPVTQLLRIARLAASRLGIDGLTQFFDDEENGYSSDESLPVYRRLPGIIEFGNGAGRWLVMTGNFQPLLYADPIGEIVVEAAKQHEWTYIALDLAAIMQRFELRRNTRAFWQPDFGFRRHADGRHRHRHRASVCGGRGLRWKRFAV